MANKRIPTADLDFDQIKTNLKTFLQGQSEFQDYNFDGSAMSVLLDVLAYNTHYNSLYKNLAVNEMFLDSASKRSSVVSRAKEIGYIPSSAKSAVALISLTLTPASGVIKPKTLILPAYTSFSSTVNGVSYTFYTLEDNVASIDASGEFYTFTEINIREGTPLQYKYTVVDGQRYIIPNADADLSTLTVRVQENSTSGTYTTFNNNEDLLNATSNDAVFFVKEIDGQLYELEFGNGIIGKALSNGNVVTINYVVSNKTAPNGCKTFIYQGPSLLGANPVITTLLAAYGGSDIEDIESIRFNAPRAYATQNRAVTVEDYKTLIVNNFSEADSVSVWGGEDNLPPVYGKVFICVKPKTTLVLTDNQKQFIKRDVLKNKNVVSITPELVDATYIDIELSTNVYFNPRATGLVAEQIQSLVYQTIIDYNNNYLNRFDGIFRYSKLSSLIDKTEDSIVSNITTIKLHRAVEVKYNAAATYTVNLANPIYDSGAAEQSILSSGFYISGNSNLMYVEDLPSINPLNGLPDGTGTFKMFYLVDAKKIYYKTLGSINYNTGIFSINDVNIVGIDGAEFKFIIKTQSNDVASIRNQLISIPTEMITVNIIADKVASGDSSGNTNYIFSSSRN